MLRNDARAGVSRAEIGGRAMATRKETGKTGSDKDRRREAKTKQKEAKADMKAARVRRYDAKTDVRKKAGGAGMSIVFYEVKMPDGSRRRVGKRGRGDRSGR